MATDALADPDIVRAARYMIERHGPRARLRAHVHRLELIRTGEHGAATVWDQLIAAIRELQAQSKAPQPEPEPNAASSESAAMQDYELILIGTSGRQIAVQVLPSADDAEAVRGARELFNEYPMVAEIVVRRDSAFVARVTRD
jgi:hypothetical protein